MNNNKAYLTEEGKKKLINELNYLAKEKRPQLVKRIANARTMGDLSENSDYLNAKEELSFIDGRINELKEILARVKIIKRGKSCRQVGLGCRVVVKNHQGKKVFQVVGEWEVDPTAGKISPSSPLGRALLGKKAGEKVALQAPAGKITYTILAIE